MQLEQGTYTGKYWGKKEMEQVWNVEYLVCMVRSAVQRNVNVRQSTFHIGQRWSGTRFTTEIPKENVTKIVYCKSYKYYFVCSRILTLAKERVWRAFPQIGRWIPNAVLCAAWFERFLLPVNCFRRVLPGPCVSFSYIRVFICVLFKLIFKYFFSQDASMGECGETCTSTVVIKGNENGCERLRQIKPFPVKFQSAF
jgi:hypothetical protein